MTRNDDVISLKDFIKFVFNNYLIIFSVTIIFALISFLLNSSINDDDKKINQKFVDIKFLYQENEISYLMNHIDQIFDTSSVNVNFHHMFLDIVKELDISKESSATSIKNIIKKVINDFETKFSKKNHIQFVFQSMLTNSQIENYLTQSNIPFKDLSLLYNKDHSLSLRFITESNFEENDLINITKLLNIAGMTEVEKAIELKILYHDNLINQIIKDLKQISELNKKSYYRKITDEKNKIKFAIETKNYIHSGDTNEDIKMNIEILENTNFLLFNKDYLEKRLIIIDQILNNKNAYIESVELTNNFISRFEKDSTSEYVKEVFYKSDLYKKYKLFNSFYSVSVIDNNYKYSLVLVIFPLIGFLFGIILAYIYRKYS